MSPSLSSGWDCIITDTDEKTTMLVLFFLLQLNKQGVRSNCSQIQLKSHYLSNLIS